METTLLQSLKGRGLDIDQDTDSAHILFGA